MSASCSASPDPSSFPPPPFAVGGSGRICPTHNWWFMIIRQVAMVQPGSRNKLRFTEDYNSNFGPLLDPPNEDDLVVCLREIGDWYTMGLKLDIPTQMLDEIKANKGAVEQKREMFRKWLQSRSEPSWKHILSILDDLGISRPAEDIRSRYEVSANDCEECNYPSGKRPFPVIKMPKLSDKPTLQGLSILSKGELKVKVMEELAPRWDTTIAIQLNFNVSQIEQIRNDNQYQSLKSCQDMFSRWLTEGFRRPVTWKTLIEALDDADFLVMAQTLREILAD